MPVHDRLHQRVADHSATARFAQFAQFAQFARFAQFAEHTGLEVERLHRMARIGAAERH